MTRTSKFLITAASLAMAAGLAACNNDPPKSASAADSNDVIAQYKANPKYADFINGDKISGYVFASPETQAMQDDEFENPGMLAVQDGEAEWNKVEGAAGKSCASCHGDAAKSMKGVAVTYPKYEPKMGKLAALEHRINLCRTEYMKAPALKWDSKPLLGLDAYVEYQSRGMPINVKIDGPAAPFFEKGKEFYYTRRGQMDIACAQCHEQNAGKNLGVENVSQGQSNGYPTYRLKWQSFGSLHRRFQGCNQEVRAQPYPRGSDEYTNLELYVAWRGNGLKSEAPSVRR
ncbi:MAG TPA: sulfur oxidation c-type cytochrome SoxA [Ferrovibrio sp.]|uniref:sulfur oxidation c-type cytochrome SoxA n=1 Tax=Ferrovibrio sp. TaxID=1917215 RepID=UPI002ED1A5F1